MLAATLAACSSLLVDGRSIDNTAWRAVSVGGQVPEPGHEPTMQFEAGTVRGNAGCNGYTGQEPARIDRGRLDVEDTLITLGGCIDAQGRTTPWGELEPVFMHLLTGRPSIAFRGDQLVLSSSNGEIVFERAP